MANLNKLTGYVDSFNQQSVADPNSGMHLIGDNEPVEICDERYRREICFNKEREDVYARDALNMGGMVEPLSELQRDRYWSMLGDFCKGKVKCECESLSSEGKKSSPNEQACIKEQVRLLNDHITEMIENILISRGLARTIKTNYSAAIEAGHSSYWW